MRRTRPPLSKPWEALTLEERREYHQAWRDENRESVRASQRKYRAANIEKERVRTKAFYHRKKAVAPEQFLGVMRERHYKYKYGLTSTAYIALLVAQGGVCALCDNEPSDGERLHVDHDHATKKVRGLLHRSCNLALGVLENLPFPVLTALAYIANHKVKERT